MEATNSDDPPNLPSLSLQCRVCGDVALHSNYGQIVCAPCKMFFRRNAPTRHSRYRCDGNNDCPVNIYNRHICPACRMAKCFANGMRVELIRSPLSRPIRSRLRHGPTYRSTEQSTLNEQTHQLPTTNLLQTDQVTFDAGQWTRLASLNEVYDDKAVLSTAQQILLELERASTTNHSALVQSFFAQVYEASGRYLRTNADLCRLSSHGHSLYLRNAAENVTCLGTSFVWSRTRLDQCPSFVSLAIETYGSTAMDVVRPLLRFIDSDAIISKLALSLFAFSPNFSHFLPHSSSERIDTLALLRLEHSYTDLTWNYLLHKYGLKQSVRRWNNVIQCLLAATETVAQSQSINKHVNDIETLVEEIELTLVLDQVESTDAD